MPDKSPDGTVSVAPAGPGFRQVDADGSVQEYAPLEVTWWDLPGIDFDITITQGVDIDEDGYPHAVIDSVAYHRRPGPDSRPISHRAIHDVPIGSLIRVAWQLSTTSDGVSPTLSALAATLGDAATIEGHEGRDFRASAATGLVERTRREVERSSRVNEYGVEELRAIADAYLSVGNRKRYEAIRAAYRSDPVLRRLRTPSNAGIKARVNACRDRIDPATGETYLPSSTRRT